MDFTRTAPPHDSYPDPDAVVERIRYYHQALNHSDLVCQVARAYCRTYWNRLPSTEPIAVSVAGSLLAGCWMTNKPRSAADFAAPLTTQSPADVREVAETIAEALVVDYDAAGQPA